ncbi:hypothetical protein [Corynebacterium cystitidis]|uniref:hypothetical protein n=1 Tax=Corynebacterium cystitidis TaxID=35757 RepID=UPI00211E218B|nr:hypothetical protein [Corynebacterium cystitidis]
MENDQPPLVDFKEQFAHDRAAAEADFHAGNWESLPHHAEVLPGSALAAATQQMLGL